MGMGYGMGESLKELADKRLARLAERYGKPEPVYDFVPDEAPVVVVSESDKELTVFGEQTEQEIPAKKKGGRPKGSKNKRAE